MALMFGSDKEHKKHEILTSNNTYESCESQLPDRPPQLLASHTYCTSVQSFIRVSLGD